MFTVRLLGEPMLIPPDGLERSMEKASAVSKSASGRRLTVMVLMAKLAGNDRVPFVERKSSPGPVPPVANPLVVV